MVNFFIQRIIIDFVFFEEKYKHNTFNKITFVKYVREIFNIAEVLTLAVEGLDLLKTTVIICFQNYNEYIPNPLGIYRNFIDSWILLPSSEESLVLPSFMGKLLKFERASQFDRPKQVSWAMFEPT